MKRWLPYLLLLLAAAVASGDVRYKRGPTNGLPVVDVDGNGLYEEAWLFDADHDGSSYTTCTAKDAPFPECKIAGQIVYPDTADDLNVMIRDYMEPTGTIHLRGGWHVIFPCWNVHNYLTGGTASNPDDSTTRDTTGDASYAHCPLSKDGYPAIAVNLAGWRGTIEGIGASYQRMDTSTATVADFNESTWIAIDTGRQIDSWYNVANFRAFIFGYPNDIANATMAGTASYIGQGGGGYGRVKASVSPKDIRDYPDNTNNDLALCVCATDAGASCANETSATEVTTLGSPTFDIQSATTKTQFILEGQFSSLSTKSAAILLRPRAAGPYSQGNCATAQEVEVDLAISEANIETPTYPYGTVTLGPWREIITGAAWLSIVRDDYFNSAAQIRDVTFIGNDWVGEAGGDCGHAAGLLSYTFTLTDDDCDSSHHVGIAGYQTRTALMNVGFLYGHGFQVDGEIFPPPPVPVWDGVTFRFGNGRATSDPGFGWFMKNTRVMDYFTEGGLFDEFGLYRKFENLEVERSRFAYVTNIQWEWWDVWKDIRIRDSIFTAGISIACGAKFNRIENLHASGRIESPSTAGTYGLVHFGCDPGAAVDANEIVEGNVLIGLIEDPPGAARFVTGGEPGNGGGQVLVTINIPDDADFSVMGNNLMMRSQCLNDRAPTAFGGAPNTTEECVLLAAMDSDDADGTISNEVDFFNRFLLIGNLVRGSLYGHWGYEGFYDTVSDPSTASTAAVNELFARVRSQARLTNTVIDDSLAVFPVRDADAVVFLASNNKTCDAACAVGGMVCDASSVAATNVTIAGAAGDEITTTACNTAAGAEDFKLCPCRRSAAP